MADVIVKPSPKEGLEIIKKSRERIKERKAKLRKAGAKSFEAVYMDGRTPRSLIRG